MTQPTQPPPSRKSMPVWVIWLAGALAIILAVGAVYGISRPTPRHAAVEYHLPGHVEAPVWMPTAPPSLKKTYAFAAAHFEELRYIPCYCGCDSMHKDNFECYFKHDGNGNITGYEEHAYG